MRTFLSTLALALSICPSNSWVHDARFTVSGNARSINSNAAIASRSPLFRQLAANKLDGDEQNTRKNIWGRVTGRFDTIKSANLPPSTRVSGLFQRVKDVHNPITYLILSLLAGLKWDWCFRNPYYWFAVAFCVKWYRARYVFKIPVWDRQPNWNNIITSKEQEKDLKAFTCKNCGSTIFIAKTREFFFEGSTGIGGLGCFSCGAKGKDNFIMDRDRIVEDVGDMDDYFDYEQPLDFVSRAERRKILKETKGDEEAANKLLIDRANAAAGVTPEAEAAPKSDVDDLLEGEPVIDAVIETSDDEPKIEEKADDIVEEKEEEKAAEIEVKEEKVEEPKKAEKVEPEKSTPKAEVKKPKSVEPASDDDLDILDLDG